MKKRLLSGLLCGTLTMSLLGGTAIPVLADDDQTITMWTVFTGSDGDILREIVKDYNESNEDGIKVDIDIMDGSTLQAKLPTAISTNTAPDFVLMGIEYIYQYANNDMIIPLDDFWEKTGLDESNYLENVVDKSKVDGTLYGVEEVENLDEALANGAEYVEKQEVKVEIGQTMAFMVLAFSELVHVFNIRNNKKSVFKTHPFNNKMLLLAIGASAALMLIILLVPALRHIFSIPIFVSFLHFLFDITLQRY